MCYHWSSLFFLPASHSRGNPMRNAHWRPSTNDRQQSFLFYFYFFIFFYLCFFAADEFLLWVSRNASALTCVRRVVDLAAGLSDPPMPISIFRGKRHVVAWAILTFYLTALNSLIIAMSKKALLALTNLINRERKKTGKWYRLCLDCVWSALSLAHIYSISLAAAVRAVAKCAETQNKLKKKKKIIITIISPFAHARLRIIYNLWLCCTRP